MAAARLTRDEKKAVTRSKLIEAAIGAFAEGGIDGTSLEQVAERAGLTKGAIYSNFGSKDDLVLAVIFSQSSTPEEVREIPGDSLNEAADSIARFVLDKGTMDATAGRLESDLYLYAFRRPELLQQIQLLATDRVSGLADALQSKADAINEQLPMPAQQMTIVIDGLIAGLGQRRLLFGEKLVPDELFVEALRLVLRPIQPKRSNTRRRTASD